MNWNFSAWSIKNPVPSVVLFIVLCAIGLASFMTMPVTRFPNIDVPIIAITISQAGAAPSELETQVARKVEDSVAGVSGVKHLQTTLQEGSSTTVIEFRLEINTDRALNDVKDAIAKIRGDLPRTIDEPIIQRIDVEGQAILTYSASSPGMTLEQLSWHVDDVVKREIQALKGVGRVERYGGVDREIKVALDPDRMLALGITASEVNQQLRLTNADFAGGRGDVGGQEQAIRTLAGAKTVADLAETKINLSSGAAVRLDEIARVYDSYEEPKSFARLNGQPVVAFAIFRAKGASDVSVKRVVDAKVAELMKANPEVDLRLVDDTVAYTFGNYEAAMETLIEGAVLAVIVVLLFLRDWRATLISAFALPLSIIPTFFIMQWMGFSLNLVSMLALTLATGILVDDAIVEIENIVRHMRMGKSAYRAAMEAADEIGLAVIAITMTIIMVFAPVSFMGGIAGQYFRQFGLTVAISVFVSLLVARLITPMMAAYFLHSNPKHHHDGKDGLLMRGYTAFLDWTVHRWWSVLLMMVVSVGLFQLSMAGFGFLPAGFIPQEDASRISLSSELPPGSTLEDSAKATDRIGEIVRTLPEVKSVFVLGGAKPTGAAEPRNSVVSVELVNKTEREISQGELEPKIAGMLSGIPDVRIFYTNPRGERALQLSVMGADGAGLEKAVAKLETAMRSEPTLYNVTASTGLNRPEIRIVPKFAEMTELGITPEALAEAIRVATLGDFSANLAKFNAGDRQIPIRVQIDEAARADLTQLGSLRIRTANGEMVPISSIADITFGQGPSTIERFDRTRRVTIGADLADGVEIGPALDKVYALPAAKSLPAGVKLQTAGDAEIMGEVFAGFAMAMGAGVLMVLGLMTLLLRSFFLPFAIIVSLPLSLGGVVLALLYTNNAVSMPVVIGILMLMGIVTKNAILLVDFAVEQVRHGTSPRAAIVDAGRKRARPIIMTTVAMAAGMVPTAMAFGEGGEFRAPMAIAVIGGLIVSTVLSLVFVPSFYILMNSLGNFFGWLFGRFLNEAEDLAHSRRPPVTASGSRTRDDDLEPSPMPMTVPQLAAE